MSLEQSIANLTTQAGLLLDLPQQITTTAQTQINAIGQAYQGWLATHNPTLWVDPLAGSDANLGHIATAPMKTLKAALGRTPQTGDVLLRILNNYNLNATEGDIDFGNRRVFMVGCDANANVITRTITTSFVTPNYHFAASFIMGTQPVTAMGLNFQLPQGAIVASPTGSGWKAAFFAAPGHVAAIAQVTFQQCAFSRPVGADGYLMSNTFGQCALGAHSIAYTTAEVAGRWVVGIAAGTDPKTRPDAVLTRLPSL